MKFELSEISNGVRGTDETVSKIIQLVLYDVRRPALRSWATKVLRENAIPAKSHLSEARALFNRVKKSIRYQNDPIDVETVQSPTTTLQIGAGDCDDFSALLAGLALSVGIPARFRVVGYDADTFVHIFPELFVGGRWIPADATESGQPFGWRPPTFPFERVYDFTGKVSVMSQNQTAVLSADQLSQVIRDASLRRISTAWERGQVNVNDLRQALKAIDAGKWATQQTALVHPVTEAIARFVNHIEANQIASKKPTTSNGLSGLSGILDDLWNGVKTTVKDIVGAEPKTDSTGAVLPAKPLIQISPTIKVPENVIQTEAGPEAAKAFGLGFGGAMLPLVLVGVAVYLFTRGSR